MRSDAVFALPNKLASRSYSGVNFNWKGPFNPKTKLGFQKIITQLSLALFIYQVKTRKNYQVEDHYYYYISKHFFASPFGAEVGTREDKPKDKEQENDKDPMCYPVVTCGQFHCGQHRGIFLFNNNNKGIKKAGNQE